MPKEENVTATAGEFYDQLGNGYQLMINWEARLKREAPFFRKLFTGHNVKRVLDVACGTGHHALEFARRGFDVAGCDISPEMVRLARQNAAAANVTVDFFQAGLTEIAGKVKGNRFDAVVCLGNSLPHLLTQRELDRSMRSIRRVLAPGGVFVSQIRNYDRILHENLRFMPPTSAERDGKEYMFFRMLDIHGPRRIDFHIFQFSRESGKWDYTVQTTRLRPILRDHIDKALGRAGFNDVRHYGDYSQTPFADASTLDLITVAT